MAEPVDPADDFLVTRGNGYDVSVRYYQGATDTWGAAVTGVFAVSASGYDEYESVPGGDGTGEVPRGTDHYALRMADLPAGRPPIRSLILDGSDVWVIDGPEDTSPLGAVLEVDVSRWVGSEPA